MGARHSASDSTRSGSHRSKSSSRAATINAGESASDVAEDYELTDAEVKAAVIYELAA